RPPPRGPTRLLAPRPPLCPAPDASLQEAVRLMREHPRGCILAVENDRLTGILTERDLLLKLEAGDLSRRVRDVMTPGPAVLRLDDPIVYALHRMSVGGHRPPPPGDDGRRPGGLPGGGEIGAHAGSLF